MGVWRKIGTLFRGYAFLVHGGAVSWSAKRQEIVSLSTTESEYMTSTRRQLTQQRKSFGFAHSSNNFSGSDLTLPRFSPINNQRSIITLARSRSTFDFIRWIIERGSIRLISHPTDDMIADALTKALPSAKVQHFASELGLSLP